jgi:death on curing protein
MVRNHGFIDGNKRTALILIDTLITRSGRDLHGVDDDIEIEIEQMILDVAAGMPFDTIVLWFERRLQLA